MDNTVYLAECHTYDPKSLMQAVHTIFRSMGWDKLIRPNMKIAIKPNLIMKAKPGTAIITHPNVVGAIGIKLKELGAHVTIVESSGGVYNPTVLKSIYQTCGYTAMAEQCGLALNFDCSYQEIEAPEGIRSKSFTVLKPLLEADLIVDVAKLKSHCMTVLSGAIKNMFGSVPGLMKPELHCRFPDKKDFGEMLVDLCERMKPTLCFVDAITAMEGNGPTGGRPRQVNLLYAGTSPYCVDLVSTAIMHMNPLEVPMMHSAIARGLCPGTARELDLKGAPLSQFIVKDFLQPESKSNDFIDRVPKPIRPLAKKLTTPRPKIRTKDCVGCGKCAESCPQHTIEIKNKKAIIHYNKCIKCYCCHEMCPMKAVDIQRFTLFNL